MPVASAIMGLGGVLAAGASAAAPYAIGGAVGAIASSALKKKPSATAPSPVAPAPIPPVTQTSQDVYDATVEARKMAMRRKGTRSTILGGETNSGTAYQSAFGQKTLLGA